MSDMLRPEDYDVLDADLNRHSGSIPKEIAFLTILAGAVYADNRERKVETQEVDALITRVRTLQSIPVGEREQRKEEVTPLVQDEKTRRDRVRLACHSIVQAQAGTPPSVAPCEGLAESVFAHACDVIYTDLEVTESEKTFVKDIAQHLGVPPDRASRILQVIAAKNRY
jgi:uncharacterized tellurite resistance protein B-like protein